jgi:hypothetical protein
MVFGVQESEQGHMDYERDCAYNGYTFRNQPSLSFIS